MIRFFVCWAESDPCYQEYFEDCGILLSLAHIPLSWNVERFSVQPVRLMVDSGAFSLIHRPNGIIPTQKDVFCRQVNAARGSQVPTILCHFDSPLPPANIETLEVYRKIETTISNAHEFIRLFKSCSLPPNFKSLGVIQGHNHDTICFCARELLRAGFDFYGIGSLAPLQRSDQIVDRVEAAMQVVGPDLHVFGVSAIETVRQLAAKGIRSFDSSRPIRAAMYNSILYSRPLRVFTVRGSRLTRNVPVLDDPLPCKCPICVKEPSLLLRGGQKKYHNVRAIHNYYHLRREIESVTTQFFSREASVPGPAGRR